MSDFRPGIEAARKALGTGAPAIVERPHPGGAAGVKLSLQEVADRVKKGRNDPRVRAWAIRAIKEAGGPQDWRSQAEAIRVALKTATVYVQDPVNTEFVQAAAETLCLDDKGFCFRGGDCDDLVVAYASATLSVGIPTQIIGESFGFDGIPSHVLAAIQTKATNGEWLRVDPSTNKPVGEYVPGTAEQWIDPMSKDGTVGMSSATGDFVGIGGVGAPQGLAATPPSAMSGLQVVGAFVAAAGILSAIVWLLPDPAKRADDPDVEHLCYRGQAFSLTPKRTVLANGAISLYEVDVGDELHAWWYSDATKRLMPFTSRAGAIGFAKNRIDSDRPPRTVACRSRMPRSV